MNLKLSTRERALFGVALTAYEKLATTTKANLEKLALSVMAVDTAIGNIEALRHRLGKTSNEVDLYNDLRITAKDALSLLLQKTEKVKDGQEELLIPTEETQEVQNEVRRLHRLVADQIDLESEQTTVELSSRGETTGKMPLSEFHKRVDRATGVRTK